MTDAEDALKKLTSDAEPATDNHVRRFRARAVDALKYFHYIEGRYALDEKAPKHVKRLIRRMYGRMPLDDPYRTELIHQVLENTCLPQNDLGPREDIVPPDHSDSWLWDWLRSAPDLREHYMQKALMALCDPAFIIIATDDEAQKRQIDQLREAVSMEMLEVQAFLIESVTKEPMLDIGVYSKPNGGVRILPDFPTLSPEDSIGALRKIMGNVQPSMDFAACCLCGAPIDKGRVGRVAVIGNELKLLCDKCSKR